MTRVTVNGVTYNAAVTGDGPPLVLLHGFAGSTENWAELIRLLSADFQVIVIDIIGHGASDKPEDATRYQMEYVARDIMDLLALLTNDPVHLLGYSMGGRLALYLAAHYPQHLRSLILESASPGLESPAERALRQKNDQQLAQWILECGIVWFVDYWENLALFATQKNIDPTRFARQRQQRLKNDPVGLANSLRGMGTGVQPSLWVNLAQINVPSLLVVGEHDAKYRALNQTMDAQLPCSTFTMITGAGHNTHLERLPEFATTISTFLHDIERRSQS